MNGNTYQRLKAIIQLRTPERARFVINDLQRVGLEPKVYELNVNQRKDSHMSVSFRPDNARELWFTVNYDTFESHPSANNNASGVVTLLGLAQKLKDATLPIGVRLAFFDSGLDPKLVADGKRNPDFIPGSESFLTYLMNHELEFIDRYEGAITVQVVGKGNLCVFERTGRREENSHKLNDKIRAYSAVAGVSLDLQDKSPLADNISFLKEGLDATVLARYHEGAWHRMQTPKDDFSNVNPQTIDETVDFMYGFLQQYKV